MKRLYVYCLGLAACSILLAGCETTSETRVVESTDRLTTQDLDTQDFAAKADAMVASLRNNGALDKAGHRPAVIAVGRVVNNTTLYIDTDLLTKKIRVALNQGGQTITDTTGGALNNVDFILSGKIIQPQNGIQGNQTQRTYVFQLSLSDTSGLAVWEEEKEISKITTRPGFGW